LIISYIFIIQFLQHKNKHAHGENESVFESMPRLGQDQGAAMQVKAGLGPGEKTRNKAFWESAGR
jgi:hypothetical protein